MADKIERGESSAQFHQESPSSAAATAAQPIGKTSTDHLLLTSGQDHSTTEAKNGSMLIWSLKSNILDVWAVAVVQKVLFFQKLN